MTNAVSRDAYEKDCIVYVSTYPPRECGIATFTADLISYTDELFSDEAQTRVISMNTEATADTQYDSKVLFSIQENSKDEYIKAAQTLNSIAHVALVSVQHEFGIFGEHQGENIIAFLQELTKPSVITFHTVLPEPSEEMKGVMQAILDAVDCAVVMTEVSRELLLTLYDTPAEKVRIIPHGIHPESYTDGASAKERLGLSGKRVLSTFGLLSRGKGIEYGIRALPDIVATYPDTVYLVLGATHPVVARREGEVYRNELIALARELGVEAHVVFHNRYLETKELLLFLEATDIYLSLSQNPNQAVSGTLSYALGAGRTVFSTSFMQAKEIVTPEVGVLLPFESHQEIADNVRRVFGNEAELKSLGKAAYFRTRAMTWPNVALGYMTVFSEHAPSLLGFKECMVPIKLDYIKKLTDDFGIWQFAHLGNPDPKFGYTLDDNARALVAMSWYSASHPSEDAKNLADTYLGFIERAATVHPESFANYFTTERISHTSLNNNENLEDANARALWALAEVMHSTLPEGVVARARALFSERTAEHRQVVSPRAAAAYIKAFAAVADFPESREESMLRIRRYADFLVDLYERSSDSSWQWFEESLTYSNGVLPEALLIAYTVTRDEKYLQVGKSALDFLLAQSFEGGVCVPVGQAGWYKKGGKKERHDQQPEEVSALVLAIAKMISIKSEPIYREKIVLAFNWFLGNNLLRQFVYTHSTGGCYDGIGEHAINLNQGAESTVSYLLARIAMDRIAKPVSKARYPKD
ncbi:MAG TPA: glycosyltransferase family 4 protein [Candidatus Paceibacterota bacterium]